MVWINPHISLKKMGHYILHNYRCAYCHRLRAPRSNQTRKRADPVNQKAVARIDLQVLTEFLLKHMQEPRPETTKH